MASDSGNIGGFAFERLTVYRRAAEFVDVARRIAARLRDPELRDQLLRAGPSIEFNIAEGATEFRPKEKARFYRIARRSASECAAILRNCASQPGPAPEDVHLARAKLYEVVAMLTTMIKKLEER